MNQSRTLTYLRGPVSRTKNAPRSPSPLPQEWNSRRDQITDTRKANAKQIKLGTLPVTAGEYNYASCDSKIETTTEADDEMRRCECPTDNNNN